ncbi:MAG: ROK family protein [Armatimonadetes bacterium]|nr:ROK family protein [Armatimonadota bacterium]
MTAQPLALAVDLGGTTYGLGLLDRQGTLLAQDSRPTPQDCTGEALLTELAMGARRLAEAQAPGAALAGLGVGIPGPVDPASGTIRQCPNLHCLDGVNAVEHLSRAAGVPAYIGNDAFCATLAELRYGAGRECDNMVMLTLGTGVGGGIALGNRVLRGPRQIMGEVGHLIVVPEGGPKCGCGNHGCLEALVGRQAIVDAAVSRLEAGEASALMHEAVSGYDHITPRHVADLAREGDHLCLEIMDQVGMYVGLAICNIIVLCDPDQVVLGGGIAAAGDVLFEPIRRTVAHRSRISGFDPARIVPAELGNLAGVYGAGALVWEHTDA